VMLGRRWPATVWHRASTAAETTWLAGEGAVAPVWSSCGSDELGSYMGHELGARLMQRSRQLCSSSRRGRSLDAAAVRRRKTAASREVAAREAAARLGSMTVQNQMLPRLGFRVGRVTPLIPGTFLVLADLIQPIPKIFCIG
jgi:hypothetical protein